MNEIRVAIAGVGNCASNLIQGIEYYSKHHNSTNGLMHRKMGKYDITDIHVVAAFDISDAKVGKDLSEAIFCPPNCTQHIVDVKKMGVIVQKGPVLDGWGSHFSEFFSVSNESEVDVGAVLKERRVDVLVIMIPTGSKEACYEYIKAAFLNGVSVVNGIPVLASHDNDIIQLAKDCKVSIVGDDFKSQIGGTILHHALLSLLQERGVDVKETYQLNYAGNMDFLNLVTERGRSKHESKKRGISAGYNDQLNIDVNVSYLENQRDNKTCQIWISGTNFGGCDVSLECKLTVVDSANSSGVVCDAIRCSAIAKEKKIYGRLEGPSAYYMKSPYRQITDTDARLMIEQLIQNEN